MHKEILPTLLTGILLLTGTTSLVAAPMDGQIVVDPTNPMWLARYNMADDTYQPHFTAGPGDPENFLFRGSRQADGTRAGSGADQMALINKLALSGANSLYMQVVRSNGGDGSGDHNPFNTPGDPSSGLNTAILDQWEDWFNAMDDANIVNYLFLYDDSANPYGGKNRNIADGTAEEQFISGIVNRFENQKNLVWVVAEEYAEAHSVADVSRIAEIIRGADDFDHPIAVHQNHQEFDFGFPNDPNIDQYLVQRNVTGANAVHNDMVQAFADAAGRYNINMSESGQHYFTNSASDRVKTRKYSWASAMAGAYVMALRMDIASTSVEILEDHGRIVEFFEQTNFNTMTSNDGLAFGDTDYLLANPGESYIAYADALTGQLGIEAMVAGRYDLLWFDVVTGTTVLENNMLLPADDQTFTTPGGIGSEVALWVTAAIQPGDFDEDGDVDGADFLKWQRGESFSPLSPAGLDAWKTNFGTAVNSLATSSTTVPEPSTLLFLGFAVGLALLFGPSR